MNILYLPAILCWIVARLYLNRTGVTISLLLRVKRRFGDSGSFWCPANTLVSRLLNHLFCVASHTDWYKVSYPWVVPGSHLKCHECKKVLFKMTKTLRQLMWSLTSQCCRKCTYTALRAQLKTEFLFAATYIFDIKIVLIKNRKCISSWVVRAC